jgi:hypothetical protein
MFMAAEQWLSCSYQPPSTPPSVLVQRLAAAWRLSDDPLEGLGGVALGAGVANSIRAGAARAATGRVTRGDKSDRATVEQALDPRTRMVRGSAVRVTAEGAAEEPRRSSEHTPGISWDGGQPWCNRCPDWSSSCIGQHRGTRGCLY